MRTALDVNGQLLIKLRQDPNSNATWVGYIEDPRRNQSDDIGALYYVVAVIFIYGLSIVMMIASHVRKNKQDSQLRTYLKEMASLRKTNRREKILTTLTDFANRKEVQDVLKTKEKLRHERKKDKKDTTDTEGENGEVDPMQALMKTPTNHNEDSVFLPPGCCTPPVDRATKDAATRWQRGSDSSSGVPHSASSGVGSPVPSSGYSEIRTPTTPDYRYNERVPASKRSPSFHEYRKWKMMETRSPVCDGRVFRFGERPVSSHSEHRPIFYQPEPRSPSLSPLCGRNCKPSSSSPSSVVETRSVVKWSASKPLGQSEVRFHTIPDISPSSSTPASIHIVDEDAVL